MREGAQNNRAFQRQVPVLEIFDIARDPVLNVDLVAGFATVTADLGEAGDARFHKGADIVVRHELRKLVIVLDQVRAGSNNAHVAQEDVPELRHLVDA